MTAPNPTHRVAAITGGAGAIGQAVARAIATTGVSVALLDANPTVGDLAAQFGIEGHRVTGHVTDVADPASVAAAFAEVCDTHGGVHILVNCAGIVLRRDGAKVPAADMTFDEWRKTIDVNLTGVFLCVRAALPSMREARWGRIITISSQGGRTGGVFSSVDYGASKAGVIGLSRTLATEVGRDGVTVNCVAPGRVESKMTSYEGEQQQQDAWIAGLPVPRLASTEDVAAAIVFLSSEAAGYITGATLDINGGGFMA
jgi:3-oxoacyl-[acyl-carrier protein] reductase